MLVAVLLTLATLVGLVGSVALWVDRQALDTDNWTDTSTALIANRQVRDSIASYLVGQLFTGANVGSDVRSVLPGPIADATLTELRKLADRLAASILSKRSAQDIWRHANRQAQRQLLATLDRSSSDPNADQAITLNLEPLLRDLVQALLGSTIVRALPGSGQQIFDLGSPDAGKLVVLTPPQVRTSRDIVDGVRGLAIVLPVAAIALFALAVILARNWRAIVLGRVGLCLAALGGLVLLGRRVIEPIVVNALVTAPSDRDAGRAAWLISTSQLRDTAVVTIVLGVVVLLVSVALRLGGSIRSA